MASTRRFVHRVPSAQFEAQNRGGKGVCWLSESYQLADGFLLEVEKGLCSVTH